MTGVMGVLLWLLLHSRLCYTEECGADQLGIIRPTGELTDGVWTGRVDRCTGQGQLGQREYSWRTLCNVGMTSAVRVCGELGISAKGAAVINYTGPVLEQTVYIYCNSLQCYISNCARDVMIRGVRCEVPFVQELCEQCPCNPSTSCDSPSCTCPSCPPPCTCPSPIPCDCPSPEHPPVPTPSPPVSCDSPSPSCDPSTQIFLAMNTATSPNTVLVGEVSTCNTLNTALGTLTALLTIALMGVVLGWVWSCTRRRGKSTSQEQRTGGGEQAMFDNPAYALTVPTERYSSTGPQDTPPTTATPTYNTTGETHPQEERVYHVLEAPGEAAKKEDHDYHLLEAPNDEDSHDYQVLERPETAPQGLDYEAPVLTTPTATPTGQPYSKLEHK